MASSSSKTAQQQTQITNTSNLNLQDTSGITVAGDGNTINATDHGAIQAATDISLEATALGREAIRSGADTAALGFDAATTAYREGLNFSGDVVADSLSSTTRVVDRAFDFGALSLDASERATTGALNFAGDSQAGIFDLVRDLFSKVTQSNQDVVTKNLDGLGSLAKQTSASSDDRVTKVAGYAIAGVALAMVLPALFKGAK